MGANILIIQAGEITPVSNSILYGILNEVKNNGEIDNVYGSIYGVEGILSGKFYNFSNFTKSRLDNLKTSSISLLHSSTSMFYNLASGLKKDDYPNLIERLKEYNIKYLIVLFNLSSIYKCRELSDIIKDEDIRMICIPDTVNNDICETDHTLGFGSCARFITTSLNNLHSYCYNSNIKIAVVQVPGGNTGWLAASSAILKTNPYDPPQLIYTPEHPFNMAECLNDINKLIENKVENIIIVASEWLVDENNNRYIYAVRDTDYSIASHICKVILSKLHIYAVPVILNTFANAFVELKSDIDAEEAAECGKYAIKHITDDYKDSFISLTRISDAPYKSEFNLLTLDKIIGKEKKLPDTYINDKSNNINSNFLEYLKPLIKPEINALTKYYSDSNIKL